MNCVKLCAWGDRWIDQCSNHVTISRVSIDPPTNSLSQPYTHTQMKTGIWKKR